MTDLPDNLHDIPPQPYLEFGYLALNAKAVITDSGGITEECTVNGVPCITMRDSTERPETVSEGTNVLVGNDFDALRREVATVLHGKWKSAKFLSCGTGKLGDALSRFLMKLFEATPSNTTFFTIRFLKPIQFLNRAVRRLWMSSPSSRPAPALCNHVLLDGHCISPSLRQ